MNLQDRVNRSKQIRKEANQLKSAIGKSIEEKLEQDRINKQIVEQN